MDSKHTEAYGIVLVNHDFDFNSASLLTAMRQPREQPRPRVSSRQKLVMAVSSDAVVCLAKMEDATGDIACAGVRKTVAAEMVEQKQD